MRDVTYRNEEERMIADKLFFGIKESLEAKYPDISVNRQSVIKNNGQLRDGVSARIPGSSIAPQIYIDDYVSAILAGQNTFDQAVTNSVSLLDANVSHEKAIPDLNYETACNSLRAVIINSTANQDILKDTPHLIINDLAVYPRIKVDMGDMSGSIRVTDNLCPLIGMTGSEVLDLAIHNTISDGYKVSNLLGLIASFSGTDDNIADSTSVNDPIVVTGPDNINGAVGIFIDPVLREKIHDRIGDYYILPSSIHEVLCLPDDGTIDPVYLKEMVNEVNLTTVSSEEVLSGEVYHVDSTLKITVGPVESEQKEAPVIVRHTAARM